MAVSLVAKMDAFHWRLRAGKTENIYHLLCKEGSRDRFLLFLAACFPVFSGKAFCQQSYQKRNFGSGCQSVYGVRRLACWWMMKGARHVASSSAMGLTGGFGLSRAKSSISSKNNNNSNNSIVVIEVMQKFCLYFNYWILSALRCRLSTRQPRDYIFRTMILDQN